MTIKVCGSLVSYNEIERCPLLVIMTFVNSMCKMIRKTIEADTSLLTFHNQNLKGYVEPRFSTVYVLAR